MILRLDLEYDGAAFYGWAAQPGLRTVESVLTEALRTFWPHCGRPAVAGRTDTGVHASGQVVTVDGAEGGPEISASTPSRGLTQRWMRSSGRIARSPPR